MFGLTALSRHFMDCQPTELISPRFIISPRPMLLLPFGKAWPALILLFFMAGLVHRSSTVWQPVSAPHIYKYNQPLPYSHDYYFGGRLARGAGTALRLGNAASTNIWAKLLPFSIAASDELPACIAADRPSAQLNSKPPKDIAADMPGLYGAPWVSSVNGNLIAALNVAVPRNHLRTPPEPILQIYRHGDSRPAFSQVVQISVVHGSKALLYRMFANGPIGCIDLVIPNGAGTGTAYIYYPFRGRLFEAEGVFSVQR